MVQGLTNVEALTEESLFFAAASEQLSSGMTMNLVSQRRIRRERNSKKEEGERRCKVLILNMCKQ